MRRPNERSVHSWAVVTLLLHLLLPALAAGAEVGSFAGEWDSTWGVVVLEQEGEEVRGSYSYATATGTIEGKVTDQKLTFRWVESSGGEGDGWFELDATGRQFDGKWAQDGIDAWQPWNARRLQRGAEAGHTFDGLYQTTYGRMRLKQAADGAVTGSYLYGSVEATVTGKAEGKHLELRYVEPTAHGEAKFDLSADGESFTGSWSPEGSSEWKPWSGVRVHPESGVIWLVVLETQWETSLAENEYSFGEMLRAFFERTPRVRVRHRRIADRADFLRAGAELAYLAEPVVLSVSGHGTEEGVGVSDERIANEELVQVLRHAPNVFLLHFSSCTVMAGDIPNNVQKTLGDGHRLAISGYGVPVDWAASAAFEMLYFDLVLARRLSPVDAAAIAVKEMPFAGTVATGGSPLGAMHFLLLPPQ